MLFVIYFSLICWHPKYIIVVLYIVSKNVQRTALQCSSRREKMRVSWYCTSVVGEENNGVIILLLSSCSTYLFIYGYNADEGKKGVVYKTPSSHPAAADDLPRRKRHDTIILLLLLLLQSSLRRCRRRRYQCDQTRGSNLPWNVVEGAVTSRYFIIILYFILLYLCRELKTIPPYIHHG